MENGLRASALAAFARNGQLLLSPVGCGNKSVELAQLKKSEDIADTAIIGLSQDEMECTRAQESCFDETSPVVELVLSMLKTPLE